MTSATALGTRKLSDVARHVVVPAGIVSTGYPAVEAKCRDLGIVHDDWQQGLGRLILGKRASGKYAATVGGVVLSIPRQVGKTFTIGSIVFALCILFPRMTVLWTAHRTRTSDETFGSMLALSHRRKVAPHIAARRQANGQQEIRFRNGSRILFGAREKGFGRGFAEVDVEVFDEAQILSERALEDMVPATNQAKHPAGALLFYMGTPPRPTDPGDVFRGKRARALSGESADQVYVELSADDAADPDDQDQWSKANPSYPLRTPLEAMQRMRENTGSDQAFLREALGVWVALDGEGDGFAAWPRLADPAAERGAAPVFGVAAAPGGAWAAVAVAWRRPDSDVQVTLTRDTSGQLDYRAGTAWLPGRIADLRQRWGGTVQVDPGVRYLVPDGEHPTQSAVAQAHNAFATAVEGGQVRHGNEPALNFAVRSARWRPQGDSRVLDRKGTADISPLVAAALAVHGLNEQPKNRPGRFVSF